MGAISARGLSKTFSAKVKPEGLAASLRSLVKPERRLVEAVRGVSFEVERGEAVAFLGPNGAGKSTTIKMLTGILHPSGGRAEVLGLDPSRRRVELARSIGAVFGQKSQLWFHLPPSDSFRLLGAVYELDRRAFEARRDELAERFGIRDYLDVPVRKLSLGERIRCEIAASLLHSPAALFLDEPTIGLDVVAKREVRALLEELRADEGTTIFLTSHDIGDIEKVCKRAIVIHHGAVVVDESMKDLKHRSLAKKLVGVKYARPTAIELPGLEPVKRTADAARFEVDTRAHRIEELLRALVELGEVEDLTVEDESLESVIAAIYEDGAGRKE
ncbi:MAG TPA: ATP-binding cassette domain-containing protein [Spirochaetales bacterium]|nr:ATP-binding cassette domain-containing protein [Spirochaetales bacterium]HRY53478.1 ATP-binding cassette domain-containing protein [Spirochaetia bacterium]